MATKKLFISTYGCDMNKYDSKRMRDLLADSHQLEETDSPGDADVILLNTCSIREKAQEKVFSELGRYRVLKQSKPDLVIGVGGCVASQEGDAILKRAPFVDLVFGPQTIHRLPMLIEKAAKGQAAVDVSFPEIEKFDKLPAPRRDGPIALISIMEGCSKYCSYCVVPYTRGEEMSRPFDDVIAEAVHLAEQGIREITLLGQNVNDYQGLCHDGSTADLAYLIRHVAEIEGIQRIRFSTSHPVAFSDSLIAAYRDVPKLANHLHLPVQHGSDRILSLMKRGYTTLEYKSKIRKLREVRPDISITSDFIVGFPGETEADFEATLRLVSQVGFDGAYSFIFSKRPGTPAAELPDDLSEDDKKIRLTVLQKKLKEQSRAVSQRMIGSTQAVLVISACSKEAGYWIGKTDNQRVVRFRAPADILNEVVSVTITAARSNNLDGVYRLPNGLA